ncbi:MULTISPECIES: CBS domain-containing protein [Arthrobacter]|uniref:magnesium transporter MgtE N-terminal domain-containing protein n=1 Tax=Arthrobacter TaxID=1663 RepID=UPI000DE595B1|nr:MULTISPECIES: CBS domain-containing protein [Arthrobacter]
MSTQPTRIFVARLLGLDVFDPLGDRLGKLRDVVVLGRGQPHTAPHAVGIVVEVPGKKRVFVPMTRLTSMDQSQIICTGLVNLRRFEQRGAEQLVVGGIFDRKVTLVDGSGDAVIEDIAMDQQRNGDWLVTKIFVRRGGSTSRLRGLRRGHTLLVDWADAHPDDALEPQGATHFVATHEDLKPADFADALQEMSDKRRAEVASELQDERLADIMSEMPEEDQVTLLSALDNERAADVLEEMDPDDAADLLADLPKAKAEELLLLMEPDEAKDVRRLLQYEEGTAGALMTPVPVILPPEATVAEALAHVRSEDLSPALASAIFICRPPLETPTGRFLGVVHIQQLLRSAPPEQLGTLVDKNLEPVSDQDNISVVSHTMASYNLNSLPVVSKEGRLVGAVTVDDLLDHLLPEDWRTHDDGAPIRKLGGRIG